jgi:hypothetical protein
MIEFAGKIMDARKHLPRHQAAGAVRACKDARGAALTMIARTMANELAGRCAAAIRFYGKPERPRASRCLPRCQRAPQGLERG